VFVIFCSRSSLSVHVFIFVHRPFCLLVPSTWPRRWWEIMDCQGAGELAGRGLLTGVVVVVESASSSLNPHSRR